MAGTAVAVGADGTQTSWPQTRSVTPPTPAPVLGSAQFGCWTEDAHQPWGPMEVQHLWCSVLNHLKIHL